MVFTNKMIKLIEKKNEGFTTSIAVLALVVII